MNTSTGLAFLLAGTIGIGATVLTKRNLDSKLENIKNSIPQELYQSKIELDSIIKEETGTYQILEKVFENEDSEKEVRNLYDRIREYDADPKIHIAIGEMKEIIFYERCLFGLVFPL